MTAELPTGTVTFLFTDVEGSTELLTRIGKDDYGALLAEHHRLIRAAVADSKGHEVDTQGEAFFAVFPSASDAVSAAARLQRDLAAAGLLVRIGLHTGQPSVTYNRAAARMSDCPQWSDITHRPQWTARRR